MSASTWTDVKAALQSHLNDRVIVPQGLGDGVRWEGDSRDRRSTGLTVQVFFPGEAATDRGTMGGRSLGRAIGFALVNIYEPAETADLEARRLADLIVSEFSGLTIEGVVVKQAAVTSSRNDGPFWKVTIRIPYDYDRSAA